MICVLTYPCKAPRGEPASCHARFEPVDVGGSFSPFDSRGPKMRIEDGFWNSTTTRTHFLVLVSSSHFRQASDSV